MSAPAQGPINSPQAVVELLARTLGREKATMVVRNAAMLLRTPPDQHWTHEDALAVLEKIAEQPGLVGITARFAKSRAQLG